MTENPIQALADLFGYLARIFSDPGVQDAGKRFMEAIDTATDRELSAPHPAAGITTRTAPNPAQTGGE